jgi:hypothetical protein
METFVLFGDRPFNEYEHERFAIIAKNINNMSDLEVLMYKDNFEDLLKQQVNRYALRPVNMPFEDKIVDLIDKPNHHGSHFFAEYTLMITGDAELLKLDPYNNGYIEFPIPVSVKTNVISFEIDTYFNSDDLTPKIMADIKKDYNIIKEYISKTLLYLNNESQKFNLRLEEFIIPILAKKVRAAYRHSIIKQQLNFKDL